MSSSTFSSTGNLYCEGKNIGSVHYSISLLTEGEKTFTTGTMWASMEMLRQAYSGELVQLSSEKGDGLLSVDVRNVSIHGSADFILVGKHTL
ncbi:MULTISPECIES: hypothetical protein [Brucella]|uniref:Uncharacterized protein n=1 Tax=Brucella lupini TaxID=255457 RepID=A0AB34DM40_9HYPH|nr:MULTISPECIES: hypothetical protein [Brucella/Ochrobactrum group]QOD66481.1 hypothetical protein HGK82_16400 [Ochrobactrum sp. MT180101]RNL44626.1 hypothetical protein D7I41_12710 [Ochrobactrum sp. MH181795]KAB2703085.1 hypothetical protein F9L03_15140 [Brucella lupini]KAB2724363.1 hypothetical protein F9K76_17450 [Brucella anthropi]KAB2736566.1 hypothetical protein F9K74_22890 [Brucella anthropi]